MGNLVPFEQHIIEYVLFVQRSPPDVSKTNGDPKRGHKKVDWVLPLIPSLFCVLTIDMEDANDNLETPTLVQTSWKAPMALPPP